MHGHTHCRRLTSYRVVLALLASAGICHANGGPAHFWLSTSATSSAGPEAPTLNTSVGSVETLYLWARPVAGKKIRNVSLNLVADATGVDFDDGR